MQIISWENISECLEFGFGGGDGNVYLSTQLSTWQYTQTENNKEKFLLHANLKQSKIKRENPTEACLTVALNKYVNL